MNAKDEAIDRAKGGAERIAADIRIKLEQRFGLFEKAWKLEIGATPTILGDAIRSEVRGSVAESIEAVAEWTDQQCMNKQRYGVCHEQPCMAEVMAGLIRKMKPSTLRPGQCCERDTDADGNCDRHPAGAQP